ncbi:MAG: DUF624 domain-containing protein [Muribaculum sp.]|nr:DUF624 domain-containing protein [Muribaculum sp.]
MKDKEESKLQRGLEAFGNIFLVNILFILFSIPVVTIGASLTAMYTVMLRIVRKEDGAIAKGFVKAFRENFKKATVIWLMVIAACVVIYGELVYVANFTGAIAQFYSILAMAEVVLLAVTLPFLFPLAARYDNTVWNTIKNAFLLAVSNLGAWLKTALAWFAPIALSMYYPVLFFSTWYLWIIIGFGLIGFGTSHTINRVFKRTMEQQEKEKEKKT